MKDMEMYERKDFIQIDFQNGKFQTVCLTNSVSLTGTGDEAVKFEVMQKFNDNLEECIKFTIGAMSAIRLFKEDVYNPVDYIEIVYTKEAKQRILSKKYRIAEFVYPDLKKMKGVWKQWLL